MQCDEKSRLREYNEKVSGYAAAVRVLSANRPTVGLDEYIVLKDLADEAHHECEGARSSLLRHTEKHGC